jgi:RecA DNA recombination protein
MNKYPGTREKFADITVIARHRRKGCNGKETYMPTIEQIRSDIERRIPGAFKVYGTTSSKIARSAIEGGNSAEPLQIPKGGLIEICARGQAAGMATVMRQLMVAITRKEASCALVDAGDSFDPAGAELAGVELDRLLWVRCRQQAGREKTLTPLEQAFKAADILIQNGGFGLIAVDLATIPEAALRRVPLTTWFRFARVAEKTECALVFFSAYPAARSCATLTLHLSPNGSRWSRTAGRGRFAHTQVLTSVDFRPGCEDEKTRKPVRPIVSAGGKQANSG